MPIIYSFKCYIPKFKPGMIMENNCLPVQRHFGFTMAGVGILPSQLGKCISKSIRRGSSMKISLFVIIRTAVNVSWTMPITGLLACGVINCLGTMAISLISARVSSDWGKCKFISSPSKSALYGVVTDKFIRNVDQGRT